MSPTHVALLRGVNVGGHGRLAMADLREAVLALGHGEVSTYLQSGNAVFVPAAPAPDEVVPDGTAPGEASLAAGIAAALAERLGAAPAVVVVTGRRLREVVSGDPFPDEGDPTRKHVVFLPGAVTPEVRDAVAAAGERAAARGSLDEAVLVDGTLHLRTPGGMGRSELAVQLARAGGVLAREGPGTARGWRTVVALAELTSG